MSYASSRFASAIASIIAGAVLAVGAFTFDAPTERWIAFAVGVSVVCCITVAFAARGRGAVQRILDLPLILLGIWAIVSARAIEKAGAGSSPTGVKWLSFSAGAAITTIGVIGLLLHEFGMERDLRNAAKQLAGAHHHPHDRWTAAEAAARTDLFTTTDGEPDAGTRTASR